MFEGQMCFISTNSTKVNVLNAKSNIVRVKCTEKVQKMAKPPNFEKTCILVQNVILHYSKARDIKNPKKLKGYILFFWEAITVRLSDPSGIQLMKF